MRHEVCTRNVWTPVWPHPDAGWPHPGKAGPAARLVAPGGTMANRMPDALEAR